MPMPIRTPPASAELDQKAVAAKVAAKTRIIRVFIAESSRSILCPLSFFGQIGNAGLW